MSATAPAGLNNAGKYTFTVQEEVCWLHQIVTDPRLLQGFKNLCFQVTLGNVPYAPLLALNYQLGGQFTYPFPEAWAVVMICVVAELLPGQMFLLVMVKGWAQHCFKLLLGWT